MSKLNKSLIVSAQFYAPLMLIVTLGAIVS